MTSTIDTSEIFRFADDFFKGGKVVKSPGKVIRYAQSAGSIISQKDEMSLFVPDGNTYLIQDSEVLASHFGIVPAVLSTELIRKVGNYQESGLHHMKRIFLEKIQQGTRIEIHDIESHIEIQDQSGKTYVRFENSSKFPEFHYEKPTEELELENGKVWIPHGDAFRFVDFVGSKDDILLGTFTIKDQTQGPVPFWLIEESCAQIMLGALRSKNGENSDYGTYDQAETRGSNSFDSLLKELKPGVQITCVGKNFPVDNDQKGRKVRFEYCCYVGDVLFFRGNIQGNNIPKRLWGTVFQK